MTELLAQPNEEDAVRARYRSTSSTIQYYFLARATDD
jgi:hypothetical protein